MGFIWNVIIKQPISTALVWLAQFSGNLGIAIVLLTIIIQVVLLPLRLPSIKSAQKMRAIKPEIDALKDLHGNDKMALAQAQMDLYKKHNISPLGGILPTLLSIPIIIALYQVLLNGLSTIDGASVHFLWLDITQKDPFFVLPVLVGIAQYVLSTMTLMPIAPKSTTGKDGKEAKSADDMAAMMQTQMKFIFPVMSGFITVTLPAGVGLYWLTSVMFAIIQQLVVERLKYGSQRDTTTTN